ncbi:MAG TPA: toxin-antitoxin system HicB family antitoxin [Solirubrobacteraceae bacterium]|nr:toxin-antitoxin system HicB family antitoxin [Solirubrobacteraceae bacterium]
MDLTPHIETLQRQLLLAADAGGDDARALGERLIAPLDAAARLTLLDVLAAAAEEITTDLAPGSVEVRLRGRDPEFAVRAPAAEDPPTEDPPDGDARPATGSLRGPGGPPPAGPPDGDDGAMARINLRMPDHFKARIEQAAAGEGLSVNAWIVRAAAAALERRDHDPRGGRRPGRPGGQRYTGWAR